MVDGDDFYIDLLFFHLDQARYALFELKTGKFQPEFAGKLNFYVALVDDQLRRDYMAPSGILVHWRDYLRSKKHQLGIPRGAAFVYDEAHVAG